MRSSIEKLDRCCHPSGRKPFQRRGRESFRSKSRSEIFNEVQTTLQLRKCPGAAARAVGLIDTPKVQPHSEHQITFTEFETFTPVAWAEALRTPLRQLGFPIFANMYATHPRHSIGRLGPSELLAQRRPLPQSAGEGVGENAVLIWYLVLNSNWVV